jgi:hypothetical protein
MPSMELNTNLERFAQRIVADAANGTPSYVLNSDPEESELLRKRVAELLRARNIEWPA